MSFWYKSAENCQCHPNCSCQAERQGPWTSCSVLNSVKNIWCIAQWTRKHKANYQVTAFNEHCTLYVKLWPFYLSTCIQSNVLFFGCSIPMYIVLYSFGMKECTCPNNLIWFEMYYLPLLSHSQVCYRILLEQLSREQTIPFRDPVPKSVSIAGFRCILWLAKMLSRILVVHTDGKSIRGCWR